MPVYEVPEEKYMLKKISETRESTPFIHFSRPGISKNTTRNSQCPNKSGKILDGCHLAISGEVAAHTVKCSISSP